MKGYGDTSEHPRGPERANDRSRSLSGTPRLALSASEAAESIGVSRDFFDEHVRPSFGLYVVVVACSYQFANSRAGSIAKPPELWMRSMGAGSDNQQPLEIRLQKGGGRAVRQSCASPTGPPHRGPVRSEDNVNAPARLEPPGAGTGGFSSYAVSI